MLLLQRLRHNLTQRVVVLWEGQGRGEIIGIVLRRSENVDNTNK